METYKRDVELLSSSIAAYAHVRGGCGAGAGVRGRAFLPPVPSRPTLAGLTPLSRGPAAHPESFGLYFVLGVCFGLVLTLCLLLIRISCQPRTRPGPRPRPAPRARGSEQDDDDDEDEDDEGAAERGESPLPLTELPPDSPGAPDGSASVFASAEELERAQRLEERERILREIWRNGQPDLLGPGTGTGTGTGPRRARYY